MRAVLGVAAEAATYKAAAMVAEWKSVTMPSDNTWPLGRDGLARARVRIDPRSDLSSVNLALNKLLRGLSVQVAYEPRNNHLLENHGIGPHFDLTSKVPALRIDPSFFRDVAAAQNHVGVGDGHLSV